MSQAVINQNAVCPPVAPHQDAARTEVGARDEKNGSNGPKGVFLSAHRRAVQTMLTLAVLGGLGYGGHHSGWKIPKFSQVVGANHVEHDDWCAEHNVPELQCIACNAELLPKDP